MYKKQIIAKMSASLERKKKNEQREKRFNSWLCQEEIVKIFAAQEKKGANNDL